MINSGGTPRRRGVLRLLAAFNQRRRRFSFSPPLSRSPPVGGVDCAGGAPVAPAPRLALAEMWASALAVARRLWPTPPPTPPPSPYGAGVAPAPLFKCNHLPLGGIPTIWGCAVWSVGAVWGQCGAVGGGAVATPLRANATAPPPTASLVVCIGQLTPAS